MTTSVFFLSGGTAFSFDDYQDYYHQMYTGFDLPASTTGSVEGTFEGWRESSVSDTAYSNNTWVHTMNGGFWGNWMFRPRSITKQSIEVIM